jgi:hypothetical protein
VIEGTGPVEIDWGDVHAVTIHHRKGIATNTYDILYFAILWQVIKTLYFSKIMQELNVCSLMKMW